MTDPSVTVTPERPRFTERVEIRLDGLPPGEQVRVAARMPDRNGVLAAEATFEADAAGVVDLAEQAPVDGPYDGVDPMGLFWAMEFDERRQLVADEDDITSTVVELSATVDGREVAATTFERVLAGDGVDIRHVDDRGIVGRFYEPAGDGPHPGVLLLAGGGGDPPWRVATVLAGEGYAVLALAYCGVEVDGRPNALEEIRMEYFEGALDWLSNQDAVRPPPFGCVGWSRGANAGLLLAAQNPEVGAVVAYAPSSVVFQGIPDGWGSVGSPWASGGTPVPYVPYTFGKAFVPGALGRYVSRSELQLAPIYERSLEQADDERVERARIPVERIAGPVLVISGTDDRLWPSARFGRELDARLDAHDFEYAHEHRCYEGAGHVVTIPNDVTIHDVGDIVPGLPLTGGGTPKANAEAARSSWPLALGYLERGLER
ncbi:acyl-CoA thioesterase/bile acid-CoA:amino acid N-acyltransferase family protein [Haloarchaeobius baliensis]|uniref:acyl-CoA thioesterase/bile acid-CoA:amino acid N-acyltransferase family protein n=1 Tax=Haloarchaeobius baliensis TaxID=1670458 RepID=UPI003F88156E